MAFNNNNKNKNKCYVEGLESLKFSECFDVEISKPCKELITRQTEEGTFVLNVIGELLSSKTE